MIGVQQKTSYSYLTVNPCSSQHRVACYFGEAIQFRCRSPINAQNMKSFTNSFILKPKQINLSFIEFHPGEYMFEIVITAAI